MKTILELRALNALETMRLCAHNRLISACERSNARALSTKPSTVLRTYARETAADNDCDYDSAVRMMRDEIAHVASDTGFAIETIEQWCYEQQGTQFWGIK